MKKQIVWIGVLAVVGIILIAVGHTKAPADILAPQVTLPSAEVTAPVDTATPAPTPAATPAAPTPKTPPKTAAAPKAAIPAPSNVMPEDIMLDLSTVFARSHQDILEQFLKQPADFDQYYVVATWSCGNGCQIAGIIDKRNGKAYVAPSNNMKNKQPGPQFKSYTLDSNLYRVINDQVIDTYSFEGGGFTLVNEESF